MRVLIACEMSGVVRRAFRDRGHDAWSCDLLPSLDGSPYHLEGDVRDYLGGIPLECPIPWDMGLCFTPCTFSCNSGVRWLSHDGLIDAERLGRMKAGCDLFAACYHAPIERVAMENPVMHKYAREYLASLGVPAFTQSIQPWQFGHGEVKRTCLWLKNLPLLVPTEIVSGREARIHKMPPSKDRGMLRSITFEGIGRAMADQWGSLPIESELPAYCVGCGTAYGFHHKPGCREIGTNFN